MAAEFNLRRTISDTLVGLGYRRSGRMHRRDVDREFSLIVDTGRPGPPAGVHPFLFLRHDGVQRLASEFLGLRTDKYVGTIGANPGCILDGTYRFWGVLSGPDVVPDVIALIEQSSEILLRYASLERLPEAWKLDWVPKDASRFSLATIYMLLGGRPRLSAVLAEGELYDCQAEGALCDQFRRFQRNLLAHMGS